MTRSSFDGIIKRRNTSGRKGLKTTRKAIAPAFGAKRISREKLLKDKQAAQRRLQKAAEKEKAAREAKAQKPRAKPKDGNAIMKKGKLTTRKAVVFVTVAVLAVGGALFYRAINTGANIFEEGKSPIRKLTELITKQETPVDGEEEDRIDIMLLGIGGDGHPGSELTDTIQILSIKPSTSEMSMLSIPRDLFVMVPGTSEYSRINQINHYGIAYDEAGDEAAGPEFAKKAIEEITGEDIEYYAKIDFEGFVDVINALGGVDIEVENSFIDNQYPLGLGYQVVEFQGGMQHMDGDTALKFARSRKGYVTDGSGAVEGTDFARSKRQQLVIDQAKEKALSLGVLANPAKLNTIFSALDKHLITDLELWEAVSIFKMTKSIAADSIRTMVLDSENYLKPYTGADGASLLIPQDGIGKYDDIIAYMAGVFEDHPEDSRTADAEAQEEEAIEEEAAVEIPPEPENAVMEIRNGTSTTGLASRTSLQMKDKGLDVRQVGNAENFGYATTIVYDMSGGNNPETMSQLEDFFGVNAQTPPSTLDSEYDFVIVLGADYALSEQQ